MFDTSRINQMMDKVQSFLGRWLEDHLKQIYPADWWERCVMSVLVPEQREHVLDDGAQSPADLDLAMQISVFRGNWKLLRRNYHLNQQLYDDAVIVKRIRNKYSHKKSGKDYEGRFKHDMETVKLFLKDLGCSENLCEGDINSRMMITTIPKEVIIGREQLVVATTSKPIVAERDKLEMPKSIVNGVVPCGNAVSADRRDDFHGKSHDEDWKDVASLLYENILACIKDEYSGANVGECLHLANTDPIPNGVNMIAGWQHAVVLHIKDTNRANIMHDITMFIYGDHSPTKPYIRGEYAIWQFPQPVEYGSKINLSTTVFLPKWLTHYLYEEKGLCYKTNCEAVQYNLNADSAFSFQYLATYFPRTFAEMSAIFDYALAVYPSSVGGLGDVISILDVGCGSGAAAIALLWSMKKARIANMRKVIVYGLDGNENFIERFKELIPVVQRVLSAVEIEVHIDKIGKDMETSLRGLPKTLKFDFIVSSKFVQELKCADAYTSIMTLCITRLKQSGIMCMLENYREGRTDINRCCATMVKDCQVITSEQIEFSIMQIPGCSCVNETVGFQLFVNPA